MSSLRGVLARRPSVHDVGWVLVPLRAFLGITFVYAGLQKLASRSFFSATDPQSVRSQLTLARTHSPIGGLVAPLQHHAVVAGLVIAFGELAVGVGTVAGLRTRLAAAGGLLLSLGFFLTVSFHEHPYFYGADIVFVFAWIPLLAAGSGDVLSLDAVLHERARLDMRVPPHGKVPIEFATVRRLCGAYERGACKLQPGRRCAIDGCPVLDARPRTKGRDPAELDRRELLLHARSAGVAAAVTLVAGGIVAGLGRLFGSSASASAGAVTLGGAPAVAHTTGRSGVAAQHATTTAKAGSSSTTAADPPSTSPTTASRPATTKSPATTASTTAPKPAGTAIGPASAVPVGGAARFSDPASGAPAFVVQPQAGVYRSFNASCTHQGCPVNFAGNSFQCPCHGAAFDAATGAVLQGPAQSPLAQISVTRGADGQLYVDG